MDVFAEPPCAHTEVQQTRVSSQLVGLSDFCKDKVGIDLSDCVVVGLDRLQSDTQAVDRFRD